MTNGDFGDGNARPPGSIRRVAISIFRYFPHGGLQRDMISIALELIKRGIDVTVFCISWESAERPSGLRIRKIPCRGWTNHGKALNFSNNLKKLLRDGKFDLHLAFNKIHGADWYFAGDLPYAGRSDRLAFWKKLLPRHRVLTELERAVFSTGSKTKIFYLTDAQKENIQGIYKTQEARMFPLPPGIDQIYNGAIEMREARRTAMREALGVSDDETMLILVSSAFHTKGVDRAIAALASLPDEERSKSRLFIAGRGNPAEMVKFASRFGVEEHITFLGARDDIPELLAAADLMVHPARNEAAGAVLLEAVACGTPVICSGNCGFAPFVEEAGGVSLPVPFRQKVLNRTLMVTLSAPGRLEEMQRETESYAANAGFYCRSERAVDLIEEYK